MIKLPRDTYGNEGWVVKARKSFRCEDRRELVEVGDHYYRTVAWPRSDANSGSTPWVLRLCRNCLHEEMRGNFDKAVASLTAGRP